MQSVPVLLGSLLHILSALHILSGSCSPHTFLGLRLLCLPASEIGPHFHHCPSSPQVE